MKQINDKLDGLNELITRIDAKILDINTKLDELIKALHEYDDDLSTFEDEPQQGACSKHDEASWDEERMDIIGQNGNEGIHYVTNEEADEDAFSDYGMRIAKKVMSDKDNVRVGKDKSNNVQPKQKQYWKNNRSKRSENKK
jgi:Ca2+-dependent lipid-binding protein